MKKNTVLMIFAFAAVLLLIGCQSRYKPRVADTGCDECPLKSKREPEPEKRFGLNLIIDQGLRNNLSRRTEIERSKIADRASLKREIESAGKAFSSAGKLETSANFRLSGMWHLLNSTLLHVRGSEEGFLEKRCSRMLAFDIAWAFWQAAAVSDALEYTKTLRNELGASDSSDRTIARLETDFAIFSKAAGRLSGLNLEGSSMFGRYGITEYAGNTPRAEDLDINSLEESAMENRSEMTQNGVRILIQKEEARAAMKMFSGVDFFGTGNLRSQADEWKNACLEISRVLIDLSSRINALPPGHEKDETVQKLHLAVASGIIAQVRVAQLDYVLNKDRYMRLGRSFLSAGGSGPETMAAKLRLDEAAADCLVAYHRLCASTGINHEKCANSLQNGADRTNFLANVP